jgi:hypothetical protein
MNARTPLAALLLLAGSASAQDASQRPEVQLKGSFDQPLGSQRDTQTSRTASSQSRIVKIVDGKQWSLTITDGDITVEEDGTPVPADRVKRDGDSISILDARGTVVETFNLPTPGGPTPPRMVEAPASHVMIGIMMEYDEDAGGLVVQHAFEGMPGHKAGLKPGDVITEVGGKPVTGNDSLRDAFKDRKPGDRIELTVKNDAGQSSIRTVELAKYDRAALDEARARFNADDLGADDLFRDLPGFMQGFSLDDPALRDRVRKAVEDAIESIKQSSAADVEKWKRSALDSLDKALAAVEKSSGEWRRNLRGGSGSRTMIFEGMPGRVFELPAAPNTPATPATPGPSADQFQKLIDALDRLNTRLDALEKRLEDRSQDRK